MKRLNDKFIARGLDIAVRKTNIWRPYNRILLILSNLLNEIKRSLNLSEISSAYMHLGTVYKDANI